MAKNEKKNPSLRIIKVVKHKGYSILIQQIVAANIFQCIVAKDDKFWQAHEIFSPDKSQKTFTMDDILKCGMYMLDVAFQIIDELESIKNMPAGKRAD